MARRTLAALGGLAAGLALVVSPAGAHVSASGWPTAASAYGYVERGSRSVAYDLDVEALEQDVVAGTYGEGNGARMRANVIVNALQHGERVSVDKLQLLVGGKVIETAGKRLGPGGAVNQVTRWRGPTCQGVRARVFFSVRWRDGRLTSHVATSSGDPAPYNC